MFISDWFRVSFVLFMVGVVFLGLVLGLVWFFLGLVWDLCRVGSGFL